MIQAEWSAKEFGEMLALEQIDPSGEERMDWRFGMLCANLLNAMPFSKNKCKPSDFMPEFGAKEKPESSKSIDQMGTMIMAWAYKQGAKAVKQGDMA